MPGTLEALGQEQIQGPTSWHKRTWIARVLECDNVCGFDMIHSDLDRCLQVDRQPKLVAWRQLCQCL